MSDSSTTEDAAECKPSAVAERGSTEFRRGSRRRLYGATARAEAARLRSLAQSTARQHWRQLRQERNRDEDCIRKLRRELGDEPAGYEVAMAELPARQRLHSLEVIAELDSFVAHAWAGELDAALRHWGLATAAGARLNSAELETLGRALRTLQPRWAGKGAPAKHDDSTYYLAAIEGYRRRQPSLKAVYAYAAAILKVHPDHLRKKLKGKSFWSEFAATAKASKRRKKPRT